jgi:hypothetical protein
MPRPGVREQWSSSPHMLALMNDGFWRKAVVEVWMLDLASSARRLDLSSFSPV